MVYKVYVEPEGYHEKTKTQDSVWCGNVGDGTVIDGDERMRFALHDLNGDGTNEMLVMLDEEVCAIHTIGEDGAVVLTYSCPAGSEMTVMADETIRVTSQADGDSRTYRMTADPYGLVDAGTSQTDKPLVLQSRPMSPHAE